MIVCYRLSSGSFLFCSPPCVWVLSMYDMHIELIPSNCYDIFNSVKGHILHLSSPNKGWILAISPAPLLMAFPFSLAAQCLDPVLPASRLCFLPTVCYYSLSLQIPNFFFANFTPSPQFHQPNLLHCWISDSTSSTRTFPLPAALSFYTARTHFVHIIPFWFLMISCFNLLGNLNKSQSPTWSILSPVACLEKHNPTI